MRNRHGFTVIELIVVIVLLSVGAWVFFSQKATADAIVRDDQRKTAINAMYFSLEEVYYPTYNAYPVAIDSKTLRSVDPELFTDPQGVTLGKPDSNYQYEGIGCGTDDKCSSYRLTSSMEREAEYEKTSRRD